MNRIRVFIDADALFAASASGSEHGASLVVLRLGEITLIDLVTSEQVITEVQRNLQKKMPTALLTFQLLCQKSLTIIANPTEEECLPYKNQADPKDLPILVAALQSESVWLLTFNLRHFYPPPESIKVALPGTFIQEIRHLLTQLY